MERKIKIEEDPVTAFLKAKMLLIVIVGVGILLFALSIYSVPGGHVGVKFNKLWDVGFSSVELPEGFGLKVPIVQVIYKIPYRTQTVSFCDSVKNSNKECDYSPLTPKDKNGINFMVDVTVRYRLDQTQGAEFIEQKGSAKGTMETLITTAARADSTRGIFGKFAQEDVPKNRIEIAELVKLELQKRLDREASGRLKPGFMVIEAVDIRNTEFNEKIEQRIIQKQEKLQEAQEMVYIIETANRTREKELINADRDKKAAILRAEGEAEAILLVATAKAAGIQKVNDAYQNMPTEYVSTKWAESIRDNDKIIFGLENLGGGLLPFLNINEIVGTLKATNNLQTPAEEE